MGFLGEAQKNQTGRSAFTPRCNKDEIEELIFASRRDLFTSVDLVFFDTTSNSILKAKAEKTLVNTVTVKITVLIGNR